MILAVLFGSVVGFAGSLPLVLFENMRKKRLRKGQTTGVGIAVAFVVMSLFVMSIALLTCSFVANEAVLPFAISMLMVFLIVTITMMVIRIRKYVS